MTKARQGVRTILNEINNNKARRVIEEGIIESIEWTSKTAVVKIIKDGFITRGRVAFSKAYSDEIDGSMPTVGSKCLVYFLSEEFDKYEDVVIAPMFLFDEKRIKPQREGDGNKDKNYHSIKPKNGGKIDLYKGNDNKDRLLIESKGYLNVLSQDFVSIGAKEISGDDNWVVLSKHLEVYNSAVQELLDFTKWVISNPPSIVTTSSPPTPAPFVNLYNPISVTTKYAELEAKLNTPTANGGLKEGVGSWNRSNKLKSTK